MEFFVLKAYEIHLCDPDARYNDSDSIKYLRILYILSAHHFMCVYGWYQWQYVCFFQCVCACVSVCSFTFSLCDAIAKLFMLHWRQMHESPFIATSTHTHIENDMQTVIKQMAIFSYLIFLLLHAFMQSPPTHPTFIYKTLTIDLDTNRWIRICAHITAKHPEGTEVVQNTYTH